MKDSDFVPNDRDFDATMHEHGRVSEDEVYATLELLCSTQFPTPESWRGEEDNGSGSLPEERFKIGYDLLFNRSEETRRDVVDMMLHGTLGGYPIPPAIGAGTDAWEHRDRLLDIYDKSPEVARVLTEYNIGGFHGTNSSALPGIFQHQAIMSSADAHKEGIFTATGAHDDATAEGSPYVSFAAWSDVASLKIYTAVNKPLTVDDLQRRIAGGEATVKNILEDPHVTMGSPLMAYTSIVRRHIEVWQGQIDLIARAAYSPPEQLESPAEDPDALAAELILANFSIAFGLSLDGYMVYPYRGDVPDSSDAALQNTIVRSPYLEKSDRPGEFTTAASTPLARTPVAAVPGERMSYARKLLDRSGLRRVRVIPLEVLAHDRMAALHGVQWAWHDSADNQMHNNEVL